ncbi:nickel ABC transporter, nickel/metallophore periplasmic binding protein [Gracilibacillus oryzae]|uniref:Nickel ABC transporter, nickel/metallophore periplasmic binding protein n=1 Tax=Gracilibacillus oryzae TaxID=1672701 RepID=A0A7C8GRA4_9BACI|nr:nickel ABC transporter substrate-binding protein [Gracilibacillus oryzae]KAB8126584.1 nickel ABC transporter, nickel/metallophore periplasmic binding protein [Gracilibacillus oryzae]
MNLGNGKIAFLVIFLIISLVACSNNNIGNTKESEDTVKKLTISWNKDIGEINPHMYAPNEMYAQDMVYESLVRYGEKGKIEPGLAKEWDISKDGKEYIFHLREGIKFSDGSEFNASIVKKNFDAILSNAERHNWIEAINQIENTSIIDESTFKITLKNSYYPLLQDLTLVRPFRFLGEAGFPEDGNTAEGIKQPIGTGPWVLSEYKQDEVAVFKQNEFYWGEKPKIEELEVKIIPDGESRVIAFENGEIDLILGTGLISLDSFQFLKDSGNYQTGISNPLATRTIAINSNKEITKDLAVRQAVQHAFNKQAVIDYLFYGTEQKADTLFASNVPYSDLDLNPYGYDVEKAKSLLEEAGWKLNEETGLREKDGQSLELDLVIEATDNIQKSIAETLQGDLEKVGIRLHINSVENQSYLDRQKDGDFHLIFNTTWGAPYEPHTYLSSMRKPAHADYQAQLGLPMKEEIDKKIGEVLLTTDKTERQELYKYILGTLHEQAVYLPISYSSNIAVYHDYVSGVEFPNMNYILPTQGIDLK